MAAAGDGPTARARRHRAMRSSDADRERVIDTLKAAYVYGLVTKDEFEDRVSETLASHTYADLALITADIPTGLPAAPSTLKPAPAKAPERSDPRPYDRAIIAAAVLSGLAFIVAFLTTNPAAGLLLLGAVGTSFTALLLLAVQMRRDNNAGKQPPQHRAVNTKRASGQLPPSSRQSPRRRTDGAQNLFAW